MFTRLLIFFLVVVVVLFQNGALGEYGLQKDISTQLEKQNGSVLSRKRRYLVFPAGSSFQLVFCLTYPSLGVGSYFVFGHTAALAWELPSTPLYYNKKDFEKKAEEEKAETTTMEIPHDIDLDSLSHSSDYSDRIGTNSGAWSLPYGKWSLPYGNNDQQTDFGYNQWHQKQPYSVQNNPFLNFLRSSPFNSSKPSYSWNNDQNRRVQVNSNGINYGKKGILQPYNVKMNPFLNFLQNSPLSSQKISYGWNNNQNRHIQDNNHEINFKNNRILPLNPQIISNGWNNDQHRRIQDNNPGINYGKNRKNSTGTMKSYSNTNSFKRYNAQKSQLDSRIDPVFYPVHRRTRRDLYKKIENFLTALNLDGKVCILKAICEVTQSSKERGSFIEEIIKAIFRVKPHDDFPNEDHYDHAVNRTHNCDQMYPTCKGSVWTNLFLLQK